MKKIMAISLFFFVSCNIPKEYTYKGRMVTEGKYERASKRYTKKFIKKQSVEDILLFLGVEVVFDTTEIKNDSIQRR